MEENSFKVLPTTVNDEATGRQLHGSTVVIDGSLKATMDSIISANVGITNYEQIIASVIINGVPALVNEINAIFEKMKAENDAKNGEN